MSDSNENPAYITCCIYNKISREEEELPELNVSHADKYFPCRWEISGRDICICQVDG